MFVGRGTLSVPLDESRLTPPETPHPLGFVGMLDTFGEVSIAVPMYVSLSIWEEDASKIKWLPVRLHSCLDRVQRKLWRDQHHSNDDVGKGKPTAVTVDNTLLAPDAIPVRYTFAQCFACSVVGVMVVGTASSAGGLPSSAPSPMGRSCIPVIFIWSVIECPWCLVLCRVFPRNADVGRAKGNPSGLAQIITRANL